MTTPSAGTSLAVGIDVGGTSIKAVVLEGATTVARSASRPYALPDTTTFRAALAEAIAGLGTAAGRASAVGLCTPGILDPVLPVVRLAVNLPGIAGLDLREEVRRSLPGVAHIRVATDALASAFGYWAIERRPGRLLTLSLGTGVGACLLDDGTPVTVCDHGPGHIGQLDIGPIGVPPGEPAPLGPDGGAGSVEAYVGVAALRKHFGDPPLPGMLAAPITAPPWTALVRTIRICHALYRPDEIALLGGIGTRLGPRLSDLEQAVRTHLTSVAKPLWRLCVAPSDDLGAVGAAALAFR